MQVMRCRILPTRLGASIHGSEPSERNGKLGKRKGATHSTRPSSHGDSTEAPRLFIQFRLKLRLRTGPKLFECSNPYSIRFASPQFVREHMAGHSPDGSGSGLLMSILVPRQN